MAKDKDKLKNYGLTLEQIALGTQDAESKRITCAEVPEVVARHRKGDSEATRRLVDGFGYLVWERFQAHRSTKVIPRDSVLGTLMLDLATAVDRLARPKSKVQPTFTAVEDHIGKNLRYSAAHYRREIDENINPDRHDGQGTALKRDRDMRTPRWEPDKQELTDPLDDPTESQPTMAADGEMYIPPSKFDQEMPSSRMEREETEMVEKEWRMAEYERLLPFCKTPLEKTIVGLFSVGLATDEVTESLPGVTYKQIEWLIERLYKRAR